MNKIFITATIILFFISGNIYASQRLTLKGISSVAVYIHQTSKEAIEDGFDEIEIKKFVEMKLNDSQIKVVKYKDWENMLGGSYIYIKIVPSKTFSGDNYAVFIDLELYQAVVLIKAIVEDNKVIDGNTWSVSKLMKCDKINLNSCIANSLIQLVDIFIEDFKSMNNGNNN